MPLSALVSSSKIAAAQAAKHHEQLTAALYELDQSCAKKRTEMCNLMRANRSSSLVAVSETRDIANTTTTTSTSSANTAAAKDNRWKDTLDSDDVLLSWSSLHAPVTVE